VTIEHDLDRRASQHELLTLLGELRASRNLLAQSLGTQRSSFGTGDLRSVR
jgi:hypothetical protein